MLNFFDEFRSETEKTALKTALAAGNMDDDQAMDLLRQLKQKTTARASEPGA